MTDLGRIVEFEWDNGNIDKSWRKHKITPAEAEETFLDENLVVVDDIRHSREEKRFIALGKTAERKTLFTVFTIRNRIIRIISSRLMNKKERRIYEAQKNS